MELIWFTETRAAAFLRARLEAIAASNAALDGGI